MAEKLKVQVQDENGNVFHIHTSADIVFCEDGASVEAKLGQKIDVSNIVQNAATAATDKVPSAAVAKNLQDQINQQNTKIIDGTYINAWSYMGKFHYDNKSCIFSFDYTAGTEVKIGTAIITDIPRPLYVTIIPCTIIKADTVTFKTSALTVNEGGISIGHDLSFKDRVIATGFYNAMQSATVSD